MADPEDRTEIEYSDLAFAEAVRAAREKAQELRALTHRIPRLGWTNAGSQASSRVLEAVFWLDQLADTGEIEIRRRAGVR